MHMRLVHGLNGSFGMKFEVAQASNTVSNSEVTGENQETSDQIIEDCSQLSQCLEQNTAQACIAINISEEKSDPVIEGI